MEHAKTNVLAEQSDVIKKQRQVLQQTTTRLLETMETIFSNITSAMATEMGKKPQDELAIVKYSLESFAEEAVIDQVSSTSFRKHSRVDSE